MSNVLDNGAVLPSGLLGIDHSAQMEGFKKTFQNPYLRVGIITKTYDVTDQANITKLVPEYDVLVMEQNEDKGSTLITYKNCLASAAFGSIADFFEAKMRNMKKNKNKGAPNFGGQDGSIVLLLCLNGLSDRGIIMGCLKHPDRKTTLKEEGPRLEGEYNGVNIKVEKDGSTSLTFRGATDNAGVPIDTTQGDTVISVETDGSFQVKHKSVTQRHQKDGKSSLTADDDISNTTKKNFNVTATESVNVKATKDFNLECAQLVAKASGSAMLECQKLTVHAESEINMKGSQFQVEAESMAQIKASTIILDGLVNLGGAGGQPVLILSTQFIGTGNLGIPVLSNAISGFATKVMAT